MDQVVEFTAEQRLAVEAFARKWWWNQVLIAIVSGMDSGKAVEREMTACSDNEQVFMPDLQRAKDVRRLLARCLALRMVFLDCLRDRGQHQRRIKMGEYYHEELVAGRRNAPPRWQMDNALHVMGDVQCQSEMVLTLNGIAFSLGIELFRDAGLMVLQLFLISTELSQPQVRLLNVGLASAYYMFQGSSPENVIRFCLCTPVEVSDQLYRWRNFRIRKGINARPDYEQMLVARRPFLDQVVVVYRRMGFDASLAVKVFQPEPEGVGFFKTHDLEF